MMIGTCERCRSCAADLGAGHLRQHQVEQHDVRAGAVELGQGRGAGRGDRHLEALLAQHVRQGVGERLLVLDHQNSAQLASSPRCGCCPGIAGQLDSSPAPPRPAAPPAGAPAGEGERRATTERAGDLDATAVVAGDVLDDGQAEAGAAGRPGAGLVGPVEAFEDPVEVVRGDADALVGRPRSRRSRRRRRTVDGDGGAGAGVRDGVARRGCATRGGDLAVVAVDREPRLAAGETRSMPWPRPRWCGCGRAPRRRPSPPRPARRSAAARRPAAGSARAAPPPAGRAGPDSCWMRSANRRAATRSSDGSSPAPPAAGRDLGGVQQRLGEQLQRADRGLQLVADVGDEVPADPGQPVRSVTSTASTTTCAAAQPDGAQVHPERLRVGAGVAAGQVQLDLAAHAGAAHLAGEGTDHRVRGDRAGRRRRRAAAPRPGRPG